MTALRSQDEIRNTVVSLGLPEHPYFMRRTARAMDLLDTGKVNFVGDEIFRVQSQFDDTIYHVELNHGNPHCTCADHQKNPGVLCKHMIAATVYKKQSKPVMMLKTTEGEADDYWRRCWLIAQGNRRTLVYEEYDGRLFCNCGAYYQDCKHKQLVIKTVTKELKAIALEESTHFRPLKEKPVVNECGSNEAKALQDKLNGQLNSQQDNGNGAYCAPSLTGGFSTQITTPQLDISDPFQESEFYDIEQIEGRKNGELAWKLSNGGYCISYAGVMKLAEKHNIEYSVSLHDDTNTVIAKAMNGNERVSGKEIKRAGSSDTAMELAKRNAARQLLPLAEIKAIEHKAKLESEFDWQKAYDKCVKLVGGKAQLDCIIYDLVKDGKLRQDNPSHYDRTEWLIIHDACKGRKCALSSTKQDASNNNNDGGDNTPSSNNDDEVNRYKVLADAPVNENWLQRHRECTKLVGIPETDLIISQELNFRYTYYKNKITSELGGGFGRGVCAYPYRMPSPFPPNPPPEDEQWDIVQKECQWRWNAKQAKAEFASAQQAYKFKHIRDISGYDVKSKQFVGRPPLNSKEFIAKCQQAIDEVREEKKSIEANEQPLENSNGDKRKLQMDKKLKTWLVETDGTKKEISCREICEQFESKQNPSIVTRLRAGIDDGADISTVELDD